MARFVAQLLSILLNGVGFDTLPEKPGLGQAFAGGMIPSNLVGKIVVFFAMLFAAVEASNRMGFGQVSELVSTLIESGGQILLGVVILAIGFWLASLAYEGIVKLGVGNITAGDIAILGLVTAMGLCAMGLADDIVNLAFELTLGTVVITVVLSFGLGGREAAGKQQTDGVLAEPAPQALVFILLRGREGRRISPRGQENALPTRFCCLAPAADSPA